MDKEIKFEGPSGFLVGNFHPNEKNISKFGFLLSNAKNISEIEQKAFVLLLIKRRTFFWTPGTSVTSHGIKRVLYS